MQRNMSIWFVLALLAVSAFAEARPADAAACRDQEEGAVPQYLYYIDGTGSYYLPGQGPDRFFNLGMWYMPDGGRWFAAGDPEGPWTGILEEDLPVDLAALPADFRSSRKLGKIPSRYVVGPREKNPDHALGYCRSEYYVEWASGDPCRRWHPGWKFRFRRISGKW